MAKASPSIAPLITRGATSPFCVSPATSVWVPHLPKGAEPVSRVPRSERPRRRVRLVFTEVSSMKTSRSGTRRMTGMRCMIQSWRACLTRGCGAHPQ